MFLEGCFSNVSWHWGENTPKTQCQLMLPSRCDEHNPVGVVIRISPGLMPVYTSNWVPTYGLSNSDHLASSPKSQAVV
jgi:hypothetical protein